MYYRYGRKFVDVILFLRYFNFFNNVKLELVKLEFSREE